MYSFIIHRSRVLEKGTHFLQKPFSIDAMRLKSIKRLEEATMYG
jgi:hypothetical protein